nr:MAG TPA: hypothetical protein [Caudoviricetes sp.]
MNIIEKDDEVLHNRLYEIIRGVDNLRMLLFEMGATPAFIVETCYVVMQKALRTILPRWRFVSNVCV